ncbi:MAG: serine/threonine-protein kinase, partial [Terriglobia bacterium]
MGQKVVQKIGKYEILSELGQGGMGVVYKARDSVIGRLVALKTVNADLVSDPEILMRFYREAQSAGTLQHPNIVTVFDLGEFEGQPYIAMEFVEGESLQSIIAR